MAEFRKEARLVRRSFDRAFYCVQHAQLLAPNFCSRQGIGLRKSPPASPPASPPPEPEVNLHVMFYCDSCLFLFYGMPTQGEYR
jgi:hypothetical protein